MSWLTSSVSMVTSISEMTSQQLCRQIYVCCSTTIYNPFTRKFYFIILSCCILTIFHAPAAYAARPGWRLSWWLSCVYPMLLVYLPLRKNTERISKKFGGGNHFYQHIKRLHYGRNWNRDKEAKYNIKFESTSKESKWRHWVTLPRCQTGAAA